MTADVVLEKVILRPVTLAMAEQIVSGSRCPDWAEDYPTDGDVVISALILRAVEAGAEYEPPTVTQPWGGPWQIRLRTPDGSHAVGAAGFKSAPTPDAVIEIGYGIAESARGLGVASTAVRALLELTSGQGVKVVAETEPGNLASERVLTACGFLKTHDADDGNSWWALA